MGLAARLGLRSLRFRIVAIFVAALLALFSALAFLVWQQQRTASSLEMITRSYLPLSKATARLDRDRQRVANDLRRLLHEERRPGTGAESPTAIYTEAFARNLQDGRGYVALARRIARSAEERAVLNKVEVHFNRIDDLAQQYETLSKRFVALAEGGRTAEAAELTTELRDLGDSLSTEIQQLVRLVDGRIFDLTEATEAAQVRGIAVAAVLSFIALGFSILLVGALVVALRPISKLTQEVQRLAAGQRIGRVEVSGADEVAALAKEFNHMAEAIRQRDARLTERAEELRLLSRYLSSVLDSLQEALIVVEDQHITLANPAASATWAAERGGPPPATLQALEPGRHELRHADRLFEVRVGRFGEDGSIVVSSDITEQNATRQRLARSERLALIGQMLAQITHEVRNPLNALSLNAELMADELEALDPDRATEAWELLETISGEIERLTQVTGHYLQLARRPPTLLDKIRLDSLIDDVLRLLRPELEQFGVSFSLSEIPSHEILADGNQLRQALLNVLRNAVEAGSHTLRLSFAAAPNELVIQIADDGPGMSAEEAQRAFDPFWSSKASGTGLGLAITRQILEAHGGTVRVQTAPSEGTTVQLVLPHSPSTPEAQRAADHPGR
ncbi:MAG: HAMP domain-containing protein [Deltaproteobacteria bacterium]|nr:MAG: HAMP domain-containing protein [Deltaproteobacteria bacterium]